MDITVVGAGYAGLVTAVCFAEMGHDVTCLDTDVGVIDSLRSGRSPIYEPDLDVLLTAAIEADRIRFESEYTALDLAADSLVFLVVGTPIGPDGMVGLDALESAVVALAPRLVDDVTVVIKSTVPVGESRRIADRLTELRPDLAISMACNPEFLRQGAAVRDFMEPDRIVVGTTGDADAERLRRVYASLLAGDVPAVFTTLESAELIKYASNAFLATKLSFINEVADLCEMSGGSIDDVALGIGLDPRIGPAFLGAGPGFGGSCLPKDTQALLTTSQSFGTSSHIVHAALEANAARVMRMADRIMTASGSAPSRVGMLGITFKAHTDDVRESPALAITSELARRGAAVRVFDPRGMGRAAVELSDAVEFVSDAYAAAREADVLVVATEWPQFAALDLARLAQELASPVIVDLRNLLDPVAVAAAGIRYFSIGRPDPV